MNSPMLVRQARRLGRRRALQTAALGLLAAYVGAALVFAPADQPLKLNWFDRPDHWQSFALSALTLLGGAAVGGRWAGAAIARRPNRAGRIGAAGGILLLLLAVLVSGGWNFAQAAIRFMPFPGTTPADFEQHVLDCLIDYVGKPLAWVMPPGSVLAGLLGAWTGHRIRAGLATLPAGQTAP